MELFSTPINSPVLIVLTIVYAIAAAITTYDIRVTQGLKAGKGQQSLPEWVGAFGWLLWIGFVAIFLLNWWYALLLFAIKFLLKALPVLEICGSLLLQPFLREHKATKPSKVAGTNESPQQRAASEAIFTLMNTEVHETENELRKAITDLYESSMPDSLKPRVANQLIEKSDVSDEVKQRVRSRYKA